MSLSSFENQLTICKYKLEHFIEQIKRIELSNITDNEKFDKLKIIKDEMLKVSDNIDEIKEKIRLLRQQNIN